MGIINPGEMSLAASIEMAIWDCLTGKTRPDSGRIFFGSNLNLRLMSEQQIARAGIGRKFQKPTVFEALTVAENLELAQAGDRRALCDAGEVERPAARPARRVVEDRASD